MRLTARGECAIPPRPESQHRLPSQDFTVAANFPPDSGKCATTLSKNMSSSPNPKESLLQQQIKLSMLFSIYFDCWLGQFAFCWRGYGYLSGRCYVIWVVGLRRQGQCLLLPWLRDAGIRMGSLNFASRVVGDNRLLCDSRRVRL